MAILALSLTSLALLIWIGMLLFWGQFWQADQRLDSESLVPLATWPTVAVVIPARNEAELIGVAVRSHLTQTYPGSLQVVLVDDQSTDGTAAVAQETATAANQSDRLTVLSGAALPAGWTGKLWAMEQGFRYLASQPSPPDYVLFTDADIEHDAASLQQLVTKAECDRLDLVSLMVQLRCESFWEKLLIPAFIFFFQLLYPFPWVNNPKKQTAAAAGGCALIRFSALQRIDGLQAIRQALIDDCALGMAVKANGPIWLGLSTTIHSLRPYPDLHSIWNMVARSAYTQLNYSPWLLVGTVLGMLLVYLVSPLGVVLGLVWADLALVLTGLAGWLLMALAYWPTLKLYGGNVLLALALPVIALLYTLMTLDSARRHRAGQGGAWKGRVYSDLG
ncbi:MULTISPECIES: glycosyltransferase [Cyanophyceae]|uniref:glycosyltransferase n=1 Tax=Cyanophyceae TaxID=3028117 RepID=UPI00168623FB|nr:MULTISPECIES: glycosyltransferase [Cyanophyceae]MBD1915320.1 glycosyltransferase [Phormidium sp. FACHB-77]MBD2032809.1 glycosyltransferase [Phormidium sp. FACHB-322]MBD2051840.1 glycosyltransferase [Leptolyngbya sp. FACHB-60]